MDNNVSVNARYGIGEGRGTARPTSAETPEPPPAVPRCSTPTSRYRLHGSERPPTPHQPAPSPTHPTAPRARPRARPRSNIAPSRPAASTFTQTPALMLDGPFRAPSASACRAAELASGDRTPSSRSHQTPHAGCPVKGRRNPPFPCAYLLRAHCSPGLPGPGAAAADSRTVPAGSDRSYGESGRNDRRAAAALGGAAEPRYRRRDSPGHDRSKRRRFPWRGAPIVPGS